MDNEIFFNYFPCLVKRTLCLDVGNKKVGVAVSDPFGKTAQGLATLFRKNFKNTCAAILEILGEYEVAKIVIGLPLDLHDREGPQAAKVRFFAEGLGKFLKENRLAIPIEFWDESFSSKEAEALLLEGDLSRKKRRKVIDKLAAVLILQRFLDHHD